MRLGPYEIQTAIGAGGMGEVYKARDTRLDRTVAIKVLPPDVSGDPDRRARFEREAKTIAGLNHPHICTLFDVGEHDGSTYLVMEHLAGQTLAERLEKGPLPQEQALTIATEIADALSAAHRQGVTHRDLKPGNVMLTKSGAKLLDFGLAKRAGHGERAAAASLASVPTQTRPLTSEGTIVGTLQYMAPEQVEGKPADARTDLWALGAILYEMLTGTRAFEGNSAASLIANIMNADPPALPTLQPLTPPSVDRLVRRCLAKAPDDRWDSAHDVADELRWLRETSGVTALAGVRLRRRLSARLALVVAGALVLILIGAGVMWVLRPAAPQLSLARLSLDVRPAEELNAGGRSPAYKPPPPPGGDETALAWTPDGQALVFVGRRAGVQQLYVRRLDAGEARPLANTEGARVPAISPDGQWVAFWAAGAIRKVPLNGGPLMDLASSPYYPAGLAWGAGGRLFFGRDDGRIWVIPPEGAPAPVTTVGDGELLHVLPSLLPDGRVLLYTVRKRQYSWGDEEIVAQALATGARRVLLKDAADARYLPSGHLVFLRRGVLFAVAFDAGRVEVRGGPVAVLDGVVQALTGPAPQTGAGQFAVAATGTLAWLPGPVAPYPEGPLVTVDRRGQVSPLPAPLRSYWGSVRLSPDGRRLVVAIVDLTEWGIWLYDLGRGTLTPRVRGSEAGRTIWAPDGQRLLFSWLNNGRRSLATVPIDGTSPPVIVTAGHLYPSSFTADGQQVAVVRQNPEEDIVMVTVEKGHARVQPQVQTPHREEYPEISRDGHWLAYTADDSGRMEVYVQPYPGPGPITQVSVEGGVIPAWNPNGRELFYASGEDPAGKRWLMAVEFEAGSPPRIGTPRRLFEFDRDLTFLCSPVRCYDVAPDGQRFYAHQLHRVPSPPAVTHINLILNWFEELKRKAPVR